MITKTKPEYLAQKKIYYKKNRKKILANKRAYREPRREQAAATSRAWYAANKDRAAKTAFKIRLRNTYGLTVEEFHAARKKQQDRCAVCRRKAQLCVDHCHDSKKFRGLLCRKCNVGLGMFHEDWKLLIHAANYLKEYVK